MSCFILNTNTSIEKISGWRTCHRRPYRTVPIEFNTLHVYSNRQDKLENLLFINRKYLKFFTYYHFQHNSYNNCYLQIQYSIEKILIDL